MKHAGHKAYKKVDQRNHPGDRMYLGEYSSNQVLFDFRVICDGGMK